MFRTVGIKHLIKTIVEAGTHNYPKPVRRRLIIVNILALLIFAASLNYAIIYALFDYQKYMLFIGVNLLLCLLAATVPLSHRFSDIAGGVLVAVFEYAGLFLLTALLGRDSGIHLNYLIGTAVPFLAFDRSRIRLITAIVLGGLVLHVAAWMLFPPGQAIIQADAALLLNIYVTSAVTAVLIIAATIYNAFTMVSQAEAQTEALLRNILPARIAERLKSRPDVIIADAHADASVMFADLVGFTPLAKAWGAEKTVTVLNRLFTEFDRLASEHGLEKIKTIGDAYMVVGGVPEACAGHAGRMLRMSCAMLESTQAIAAHYRAEFTLRIGIARGPLMAGVIGSHKFAYDVWGETVNIASRLESHGVPGRIQVTRSFAEEMGDAFRFERRGVIAIKGLGEEETWFLAKPPVSVPAETLPQALR